MQQNLHSMIGYSIRATDGVLGKVNEFFFDDLTWTIRYMVVETENWLSDRKVLISLVALGKPEWETHTFSVNLTSDQVRNSPDIDTKLPVYRQQEMLLHEYYLWPRYWEGGFGGTFGLTPYPLFEEPITKDPAASKRKNDPHLRSTHRIKGFHIHAKDGEIGHVEDFIVDDTNWTIHYLVVNTGNWWPGKKVLISPKWITEVNWIDMLVYIDRSRETIKSSPEYDPAKPIHDDYDNN